MVNDTINNHDLVGLEMVKEKFSLTSLQIQQYAALGELYREWNAKINVISRKDIDNLYAHHIRNFFQKASAFQGKYPL